jgi:hypothetical protein
MGLVAIKLFIFGAGLLALIVQMWSGVVISLKEPIERDEQPGLFWFYICFEAAILAIVTLLALSQ